MGTFHPPAAQLPPPFTTYSTMPFEIPTDYGYVAISVALSHFASMYASTLVMAKRKELNVPYPNCYAPTGHKHEKAFNCAQRGHQNMFETWGPFCVNMLITGLMFPKASAGLGAAYAFGSAMYAKDYATGEPNNRMKGGAIKNLANLALLGMTIYAGVKMITS